MQSPAGAALRTRPSPFAVEWKHMRRQSLPIAAALALLMLSIPDLFWLWLPVAGAMVVWLHRMKTNETVSTRAGLRIGAFTGMVAFALFSAVLISTVIYDRLLLERPDRISERSRQQLEELAKRNPDPKVQETVKEILRRPGGVTMYLIVGIPILFLLFLSLCATGGALGAALSGFRSGP
jgi:hypothetical protein